MTGRVHAFLRGDGRDGRGRTLAEVLAFDDAAIEGVHDFIQWLFPLMDASRAVPGSPVLDEAEAVAIRADRKALAGLREARDRMTLFYARTDRWLSDFDHNHLRITRIITALRNLLGPEDALEFYGRVTMLNAMAGFPVNAGSLGHWKQALR